jgi:hypothetical protein
MNVFRTGIRFREELARDFSSWMAKREDHVDAVIGQFRARDSSLLSLCIPHYSLPLPVSVASPFYLSRAKI